MSLRINHNVQALNTHRQVQMNSQALGKSLERLSSGLRINRSSDDPAGLMISEQLRAQVASLNQAVDNSETAISMVQTAEASLNEVTRQLVNIRRLAIHAANEGANDQNMLEADQLEIENSLSTLDRITQNARFGKKKLLDGSTGANGVGIGSGVEFIEASTRTRSSPVSGYEVRVTQAGTRASKTGEVALTQEMIDSGEELNIAEGGKTVFFTTEEGDSVQAVFGKLKSEIEQNKLDVEISMTEDNRLRVTHNKYGSDHSFQVSSSTAGVLSDEAGALEAADPGTDIRGTIGGEVATGQGRELTAADGTRAEGLRIRYTGNQVVEPGSEEVSGKVAVFQNSLIFQVGQNPGEQERVSLLNTNTRVLGRGVENASGYQSLADADVTTAQGATDTLRLVDQAIDEVTRTRGKMGAFQKNTLESNLRQLRINAEELTSAESVIRDADMAKQITEFTKNSILMQSSTAMLAQANQTPQTVLSLLG